MYICQLQGIYVNSSSVYVNPNLPVPPTPTFPPWCPYIYALHLHLYFCFADKIIYTIDFPFCQILFVSLHLPLDSRCWLIDSNQSILPSPLCLESPVALLFLKNSQVHQFAGQDTGNEMVKFTLCWVRLKVSFIWSKSPLVHLPRCRQSPLAAFHSPSPATRF